MRFYRQTILTRIKSASDETAVEHIVYESIQQLKIENVNGHGVQKFISDMTANLLHERNGLSVDTDPRKLDLAIKLFKRFRWP